MPLRKRARPPVDVARRHVALRQADAERAAEGPDLLDPAARRALQLSLTSRCRPSGRPQSGRDAREGRMLRADGELLGLLSYHIC